MTFFVTLLFRVEGMGIFSFRLIFAILNSQREVHTYLYLPVIRGICYSGAFKDCLIFCVCVCPSNLLDVILERKSGPVTATNKV